jgi:hypothetical protein
LFREHTAKSFATKVFNILHQSIVSFKFRWVSWLLLIVSVMFLYPFDILDMFRYRFRVNHFCFIKTITKNVSLRMFSMFEV